MIGYAFCGSFCTHKESLRALERLCALGEDVVPIMSENVYTTDTRFGKAADLIKRVEELCGRKVIHTIRDSEPLGPAMPLDLLIIAPCTGNTLAKIALGITDTAVCMSAKAHLRQNRNLLIALASNDAMSANLRNIGTLLNRKNIFFVPMRQDDVQKKPHSLVADFSLLEKSYRDVINNTQPRPLFI
ncbi:MAG: dipicolinate synthase subunit B [Ruminococcaceae bacterium]|nr:dipicolinate synthase subunit B [Oscillospiraceae bacterium]